MLQREEEKNFRIREMVSLFNSTSKSSFLEETIVCISDKRVSQLKFCLSIVKAKEPKVFRTEGFKSNVKEMKGGRV
jgi:hypothetical protein